jgi:dTDP-4-dehydrorhamnose 3,5-epimerase
MVVENTSFRDLLVLHTQVYRDARGLFQETFREANFRIETGLNLTFVQDNESLSNKGVLRGMHAQVPPRSQGKLIRVVSGRIQDVVVDLRRNEPTFGTWQSFDLTAGDGKLIFVPEGFAHGFLSLEDNTVVSYKCTNYYHKESEIHLNPFDSKLGIVWNSEVVLQSENDKMGQSFETFTSVFF